MDVTQIISFVDAHTKASAFISTGSLVITLLPVILSFILSRKNTIKYGMAVNKFIGGLLLQKKVEGKPDNAIKTALSTVQATFQDLSFGIYLDALKITEEDKAKKIEEYLGNK